MNTRLLTRPLLPAALTLAAALGGLASAQETDIDRCASLESDAERLACFDAAMKTRAEPANSAPPPKPEAPAPAATPSSSVPAVAPAAAAPAAAPGKPAPAAAGTEPAADYRFMTKEEKRAARRAQKDQETARREYTAVVTGIRTRPHGQVAVTLDNGEEWSEQYASRGFLVRVGDTVTLKKSRFSSAYRLVDENGKGYAVTRLQ